MIREAVNGFRRHNVPRLGAALAFYTLLSLSPLLVLVLAVLGAVFGPDAARGEISDQIESLVGGEGAKAVEALVANARNPSNGVIATVVGILTLLLGATGVFVELQDTRAAGFLGRCFHAGQDSKCRAGTQRTGWRRGGPAAKREKD